MSHCNFTDSMIEKDLSFFSDSINLIPSTIGLNVIVKSQDYFNIILTEELCKKHTNNLGIKLKDMAIYLTLFKNSICNNNYKFENRNLHVKLDLDEIYFEYVIHLNPLESMVAENLILSSTMLENTKKHLLQKMSEVHNKEMLKFQPVKITVDTAAEKVPSTKKATKKPIKQVNILYPWMKRRSNFSGIKIL